MADSRRSRCIRGAYLDHLFAGSILRHGRVAALRESGQELLAMPRSQLHEFASQLRDHVPDGKDDELSTRMILEAISEIDAFDVVDKIRRDGWFGSTR